jgi:peptidoglycan-associated lipoprotein
MRKVVCLFALMLLAAWPAAAQEQPKVEVAAYYSYVRTNPSTSGVDGFNLNGGGGSVAFNANSWLGFVGEFNGYKVGDIAGVDPQANVFTYQFGPRLSARGERFTPFVHALFGGARISSDFAGTGTSDSSFSMSVGGGIDAKLTDHIAIRVAQVDWLLTRFDEGAGRVNQNNFKYSGGIVFRF